MSAGRRKVAQRSRGSWFLAGVVVILQDKKQNGWFNTNLAKMLEFHSSLQPFFFIEKNFYRKIVTTVLLQYHFHCGENHSENSVHAKYWRRQTFLNVGKVEKVSL